MGGKAHHPSSSESDYWNDESWTVDCPCGVSFDDGEEMVECDECGVWVHTACCRVPKGLATFVCDKCKGKKKKESEVEALDQHQLPPPRHASPTDPQTAPEAAHFPGDLLRKPVNEVPMLDRVHVQGPPGGDPHLFQDVPRVFSQQLWKFTGYVPKSFHTKCKDIPPWQQPDDAAERLLSLLPPRKEVSVDTREDAQVFERNKENIGHNIKKGTMITLHLDKHGKRDSRKGEGKHSKPGHKSSRSIRDGNKVLLNLKRGSEDQNRKDSFKKMRTGSSVEVSKEDEASRSEGKSPGLSFVKNPKLMKKMAVQEFMNSCQNLGNRCSYSEQVQPSLA